MGDFVELDFHLFFFKEHSAGIDLEFDWYVQVLPSGDEIRKLFNSITMQ